MKGARASTTKGAGAGRNAERPLREGLARGLADLSAGRAELRQATAAFDAAGDIRGALLASSALVLFCGIADDDYTGFEAATDRLLASPSVFDTLPLDASDALLIDAGALTAGAFHALDAPELAARAARIAACLGNTAIAAPLRCCAGLAALGYHHIGMDLANVLWFELALRHC